MKPLKKNKLKCAQDIYKQGYNDKYTFETGKEYELLEYSNHIFYVSDNNEKIWTFSAKQIKDIFDVINPTNRRFVIFEKKDINPIITFKQ